MLRTLGGDGGLCVWMTVMVSAQQRLCVGFTGRRPAFMAHPACTQGADQWPEGMN
jgi:hypothetical protein